MNDQHLDTSMPVATPIRVWMIEDDAMYAQLFSNVISQFAGIECRRVFETAEIAFKAFDVLDERPDVVILDIEIRDGMNGIDSIRPLKERIPTTPIVMHTVNDTAEYIYDALRLGASGFISKHLRFEDIADGIRRAVDGALFMEPEIARKVLGFFKRRQQRSPEDYELTDRQFEVLKHLCDGKSQKEIANLLCISSRTVDNHIRTIYQKLHVHSGIEAVAKAFREGLIDPLD
ncbi:MAG: response regulator transcription factor [Rhodothermales bacterium]